MNTLENLISELNKYGSSLSNLKNLIDKISELTGETLENDATKVFIDSILSIPSFDEYDSVFLNFKESIYLDRLNSTKKNKTKIIELEKKVILNLKQSGINDPTLNHKISQYFKQINGLEKVDNLEKINKEELVVNYEYDSLMFDYKKYQEKGIIKGLKEVEDIFGSSKEVPLEFPSEKLLNNKNEIDAKLNEFRRVKDLIELNPEFSIIKSSYEKTIYKLNEYIETLEYELKNINLELSKTDYVLIKESVENARLEEKENEKAKDENRENILETKKKELEEEKRKKNPNYIKIETLQKEIEKLEEETYKEEKGITEETKEEQAKIDENNEKTKEDELEFKKSEDEVLLDKAQFIKLREEAKKQLYEENKDLKTEMSFIDYEQLILNRMNKLLNERINHRNIEDIKLNLYKQDRTLNLNEEDKERLEKYEPKQEEIDEYEYVSMLYMEKETEIMNKSIKDEYEFIAVIQELLLNDDLDLSDYESMLEELEQDINLSNNEKQELIDEIKNKL